MKTSLCLGLSDLLMRFNDDAFSLRDPENFSIRVKSGINVVALSPVVEAFNKMMESIKQEILPTLTESEEEARQKEFNQKIAHQSYQTKITTMLETDVPVTRTPFTQTELSKLAPGTIDQKSLVLLLQTDMIVVDPNVTQTTSSKTESE